ncbi:MAG: sodium/solute symporter [Planctomycetes bacterium]|nr:sodium/solute symporter [Planctomycetota bacterium]
MQAGLSIIDWSLVALFLLGVGAVGFRASGNQSSTRDYFLGGRSIPWWAASLSIIATETSAVTFIGIPAFAFKNDWSLLQLFTGFAIGRVFLAFVFVKAFYKREYITVYGLLAERFGERTRLLSALLFLAGRVVASAVRLYAGCLAVKIALGTNSIETVIIALGLFGAAFTLKGGIKAVVWTDVILGITLLVGCLVSSAWILTSLPAGAASIFDLDGISGKLARVRLDSSISDNYIGLFAGLLGGMVLTLATHGTDQDIAQRSLTCRDARSGRLSVLGSAVLILPLVALFLLLGTLLWAWHEAGAAGYPLPQDKNELLPLFIVTDLPSGLAGLVMAGLLAAALSSFTSVLNALSATTVADVYRPLVQKYGERPEAHYMKISRLATFLWTFLLIGLAIAFVGSQDNIFNTAINVLSYFYGGLLGAFLLAILTRRGNGLSVMAGMIASVPVVLLLQLRQFTEEPANAPGLLQGVLGDLSKETRETILSLPDIGSRWWIIIGTLTCFLIGCVGKPRKPAQEPGSSYFSEAEAG